MLLLHQRYQALKLIGQGGFGRTFLAVDGGKPSKPRCVIKQFFPQPSSLNYAQKAAELFRQEAKRLKELGKHPQIPALLASCEQDGQQYLVQELIEGQNLTEELAEEGAFNEAQIRELLSSLLPVLKFVHDHQVIHRDIKPANIIRRTTSTSPGVRGGTSGGRVGMRRKGQLVLVDFGAAKFATGTALIRTGTSIGSAEYTAPEQIRGKAVFASDLFSLGVTCIHLLTQITPFDLFDSSEDTWVWRDFLINPVSDSLARILDKLLQSATKRRYQSAADVLSDLKSHPSHRTVASVTIPRTSANPTSQPSSTQPVKATSTAKSHIPSWLDADGLEEYAHKIPSIFPFQTSSEAPIELVNHPDSLPATTRTQNNLRQAAALRVGFATLMIFATSSLVRLTANHWQEAEQSHGESSSRLWETDQPEHLTSNLRETSRPIHILSKLDSVLSVALSPDGQTLVSGTDIDWAEAATFQEKDISHLEKDSYGSKVRVWDLATRTLRHTLNTRYPVWSVAISPDSQMLIASTTNDSIDKSGDEGSIEIWNLRTGKLLRTISKSADDGKYVAISPDGQMLASSADETIKLWNVQTGKLIRTLDVKASGVNAIIFSQDGETLASTGYDGTIAVWNPRTGDLIGNLEGQIGSLDSIAISADGQTVVTGITNGQFGSIATWNVRTGKLVHTFNPPNAVDKVVLSPDGKTLASSSWDSKTGTIRVWNLETGKLLRTMRAHFSVIDSLTFSPDGKTLASGSLDQTLKIWRVYR
jgi:serine/threonine protein kinase/sugar lactone lactonase YvrE